MATIWTFRRTLANKILLYFSVSLTGLLGTGLVAVYLFFADFREKDFYQRLEDKILTTTRFLVEIEQIDHDLLQVMHKNTINSLYDEQVMIFDRDRQLIYMGLDDLSVDYPQAILQELGPGRPLVQTVSGDHEIVGTYIRTGGETYYGIAKAYDRYGRSKLGYLQALLIATFFACTLLVVAVSLFLSRQVAGALARMAHEVERVDISKAPSAFISVPNTHDELQVLALKFNELLQGLSRSFQFQQHFIHHVSHELKTPIALLVSQAERLENAHEGPGLKQGLQRQKEGLRELANIIHALLDLSKSEFSPDHALRPVRFDELVFEVIEELHYLDEGAQFDVHFSDLFESEAQLTVKGNARLLKTLLRNLFRNAAQYRAQGRPRIALEPSTAGLLLCCTNDGANIAPEEQPYLFSHFFRGQNSHGKKGFGLGLVLVQRICKAHGGSIVYQILPGGLNQFVVELPLFK